MDCNKSVKNNSRKEMNSWCFNKNTGSFTILETASKVGKAWESWGPWWGRTVVPTEWCASSHC